LSYCKVIRVNTSYPGLVSYPEFMGLRMPYPGSRDRRRSWIKRWARRSC